MLVACKDLSIGYENRTVLSGLNFEIRDGDYLCIVGENGSGKSTLVKTLLKLCKPIKGEIIFSSEIKANEIGYLPQSDEIQHDFPAGVFEAVISGRINRLGFKPFFSQSDKEAAEKSIELLGLSDIKSKSFQELSGGQRQRVLLARALCAGRKILLLDEPVTGLDPLAAQEMYSLIMRLNRELGITVIMVSHDIQAAEKYSSHILHLGNKDYYFGTTSDYKNSKLYRKFEGDNI